MRKARLETDTGGAKPLRPKLFLPVTSLLREAPSQQCGQELFLQWAGLWDAPGSTWKPQAGLRCPVLKCPETLITEPSPFLGSSPGFPRVAESRSYCSHSYPRNLFREQRDLILLSHGPESRVSSAFTANPSEDKPKGAHPDLRVPLGEIFFF